MLNDSGAVAKGTCLRRTYSDYALAVIERMELLARVSQHPARRARIAKASRGKLRLRQKFSLRLCASFDSAIVRRLEI